MQTYKPDLADVIFDGATMLCVAAGVIFLGWWLVPDGFMSTPLASLTLGMILSALGGTVVFLVGLLMVYFILIEPIYRALKD